MHISTFTQKKKRKEKGGLSSPCTSAAQFSEETGPSVVIIIC
jgi:hypothetical protein